VKLKQTIKRLLWKILDPVMRRYLADYLSGELNTPDDQLTPFRETFDRYFDTRLSKEILTVGSGSPFESYLRNFLIYQHLVFGDATRLQIAPSAITNNALFNVVSGNIVIEKHVFFGHYVSILTGTHDYYESGPNRQVAIPQLGHDIRICQGAWIASNATVLGPCVIGEHAVVAAASLVIEDVPPYAIVAGVPARIVKQIPLRDQMEKPHGA